MTMSLRGNGGRLLWNRPEVVGLCAVGLLVTIAIVLFQFHLREGVLEPNEIPIFQRLFLFEDYAAALVYLLALLFALVPRVQDAGRRLALAMTESPYWSALGVFVVLSAGSVFVYQVHPLAMDESAPLMQSRIFAAGALVGRVPPDLVDWLIYPPFQQFFIHVDRDTGEIASAYWPGFALILMPFTYLGLPWLCNPLLASLSTLAVRRLSLELSGDPMVAGIAMLLTVASAAITVNAISFYSMTAHLLCNAGFVLLLLNPSPVRAFLAGLVGGLALTLHNPVPHILFAAPWLLWMLLSKDRRRLIPAIAAGYAPFIVVVGFGWHYLLQVLDGDVVPKSTTRGFDPVREALQSFNKVFVWPTREVLEARTIGVSKLWLWAAPALLLLTAIGAWRRRRDLRYMLLLGSFVLTFVGYLFVPVDQGHGWGFRYVHSAWFALAVIASAAVVGHESEVRVDATVPAALGRYACGAAMCGLLVMTPLYALQVHRLIGSHLNQLPTAPIGEVRVVLINPSLGYYAQDLVQNDPFLRDREIRMITHGRQKDSAMLAKHFPDLVMLSSDYRGSVWGTPAQ